MKRSSVAALFLTVVAGVSGWAQPFPTTCSPSGAAAPCNDVTNSLGQFQIQIVDAKKPLFTAGGSTYPGYNPATGVLTSPVLYDPMTIIGRSAAKSAADNSPAQVGLTPGNTVQDNQLTTPAGFSPAGTQKVLTEVLSANLTGPCNAAVHIGAQNNQAPGLLRSMGKVQSETGTGFPADSFFDVFVQIDLPGLGGLPIATVRTASPLFIQANGLTSLPPHVVYIHDQSNWVPVFFSTDNGSTWHRNDLLGFLVLAGHGAGFTSTSFGPDCSATGGDVPAFTSIMNGLSPAHTNVFMVTNVNDSGAGSLRQAIISANAATGGDTIEFADGLIGTITLQSPEPAITAQNFNVVKAGSGTLLLDGHNTYSGLTLNGSGTGNILISGMTLENGKAGGTAGGNLLINNTFTGSVTISNDTISGGSALGLGGGIAAFHPGVLNIEMSTFLGNNSSGSGGGVSKTAGALNVIVSAFTNNSSQVNGGAIDVRGTNTTANVIRTYLFSNGSNDGAAFSATQGATANLVANTFDDNTGNFGVGVIDTGANVFAGFNTFAGNFSPQGTVYVQTGTLNADGNLFAGNQDGGHPFGGPAAPPFTPGNLMTNNIVGTLRMDGVNPPHILPLPGSPAIGGTTADSVTQLYRYDARENLIPPTGPIDFGAVQSNFTTFPSQPFSNIMLGSTDPGTVQLQESGANFIPANNPVINGAGYTFPAVTATLSSGTGTLTGGTATVDPAMGRASFGLGFTTAGMKTVEFSLPGANKANGPNSVTITVAGPAVTITVSGSPTVSIGINGTATFSTTVADAGGNGDPGQSVTFTVIPGGGGAGVVSAFKSRVAALGGAGAGGSAGCTFSGGMTSAMVMTNQQGVATSPTCTANSVAGSYTVTATVSGVASPATFNVTNTPGPAASIAATAGSGQSAGLNSAFAIALQATVLDGSSNPVPGVMVTFTAPGSGPSGTFPGLLLTATATTNASGVATAPTFTANGTAGGPYIVTATVAGVASPANFSLTNATNTVNVTLQTSPAGLLVSLDGGASVAAPLMTALAIGSQHTIATQAMQAGAAGTQYVWLNWSDGLAMSHNITVPGTNTTYTASFKTQYQLTISASPPAGGTVTPSSGGFYDSTPPTVVPITATANSGYSFTSWIGSVASANSASTTVTMSAPQTVTANFVLSQIAGLRFVAVPPCRVIDTRGPNGPFGGPFIGGGSTRNVGVPQSPCGIPGTAQAYSLNVTVVPPGPLTYLTIWPAGQSQPLVSTLNSYDGRVVANAAIVPAGSSGAISVFASDATNAIIDINGYFAPASTANSLSFYAVTPCRVADTRGAAGPFGAPFLSGGTSRNFPIPTSPCGIPNTAQAYSFNITVVPHGPLSYLTSWPAGQTQPLVSTLNSYDGSVVANAAIVPAGASGAVSFFATNDTELIIDINGYFAPPGGAGAQSLYTVTPCRVVDTRGSAGPFGAPSLVGSASRNFAIPASSCGVPATAQAYSVNVTVVPPGPLTYLTAWPTGQSQPLVSTLNSYLGKVVANAAIVPAGTSGAVSVFVTDNTNLILDINGYFAP